MSAKAKTKAKKASRPIYLHVDRIAEYWLIVHGEVGA